MPFPRDIPIMTDRRSGGVSEPEGRPTEGTKAKVLIAGLGALSLLALFVAFRVGKVFGADTVTAAALVWPAFVVAGAVLAIALWYRRALGWAWRAAALIPWFALAGAITAEVTG